jgi:1-acyl-sn-glycerol-3-phosphate acyltransferase
MRKQFGLFRFLYKLYFGVTYIILGLLLYPFMFLLIRGENGVKRGIRMKQIWSRVLCALVFIRVKTDFEVNLPKNQAFVFCPNHTSYLDIVLMYVVLPHNIAFLGKSEILKWPIISLFFKRGVDIPVFRDSKTKASDCLIPAADELRKGRSLVIFPEGKIPDHVPDLAPFKRGAFSLAFDTGVPIVPITFYNNWRLFSDHTDFFGPAKPGKSLAKVHRPLYPKDFQDLLSLQQETYRIIENELKNYGNQ